MIFTSFKKKSSSLPSHSPVGSKYINLGLLQIVTKLISLTRCEIPSFMIHSYQPSPRVYSIAWQHEVLQLTMPSEIVCILKLFCESQFINIQCVFLRTSTEKPLQPIDEEARVPGRGMICPCVMKISYATN